MSKKKVLQYFWGKLDSGGAETLIINIFEKMDKQTYNVDFLVYENKEYFYNQKVKSLGGNIVALSNTESTCLPIRLVKRWANLYALLKKEKYDVFHCNCDFAFKWVEMMIAKRAGVGKRICHSHNSALDTTTPKGKVSYLVHCFCRPLLRYYTTDFIACSEASADWLYGKKKNVQQQTIILKNGIDAMYYEYDMEARREYRKKIGVTNQIVIGNVGRFTPIKNQGFLVDIAKEIKSRALDMKVVLIGTGERLEQIKQEVKDYGLENIVVFLGATDKVRNYLMAFDCFVMPSLYEGLPVSAIEAQATGLPCVLSDTITRQLDVTGNVKFLSLNETAAVWLDNILDWINGFERKSELTMIRRAGYDVAGVTKIMEAVYQE